MITSVSGGSIDELKKAFEGVTSATFVSKKAIESSMKGKPCTKSNVVPKRKMGMNPLMMASMVPSTPKPKF